MKKINFVKILEYLVSVIAIIFALAAIFSTFSVGGVKIFVVRSGSMEPTIKTGSIVVDKNYNNYNVGEIVTFRNAENSKETITHRIVSEQCQGAVCLFGTKGDANDGKDSGGILQDSIIGKVLIAIPYLGYVVGFAQTLPGLIILIVIPATLIISEEIKKIHHETKHIIKKRREKKLVSVEAEGDKDDK